MTNERQNWRKEFEMIGPETLRLRLETRRAEFSGECAREAEVWLLEQDAARARAENRRYRFILAVAIISAVAAIIAAVPVVTSWIAGPPAYNASSGEEAGP